MRWSSAVRGALVLVGSVLAAVAGGCGSSAGGGAFGPGYNLGPCSTADDSMCRTSHLVCDSLLYACVSCTQDYDCTAGRACINNQCIPSKSCSSSSECGAMVCDPNSYRCVQCADSSDCPSGRACSGNICVPTCSSDAQCGGRHCNGNGYCVQCNSDSNCSDLQHCNAVGACTRDVCKAGTMGCADNQVVRCNDSGSAYEIQEYCSASTCVVEGANASCTGFSTGGTSGTGGFPTGGTGGTGGYTGGTGGTSGTGGIVNNCASTTNPGIASFDSWYPYTTNMYYGYTADSRTVYAQFGDDSGYGTGELVSPGATTVSTYAAHLTTPSAYAGATIQITFDLCLNASSWSTGLFWYSHESGPVTVVLYDSLGYSYVYTYAANAGWYLHQVPWTSFAPSFPPQDLYRMEFDVAGAGQVDMWLDDVQYY